MVVCGRELLSAMGTVICRREWLSAVGHGFFAVASGFLRWGDVVCGR